LQKVSLALNDIWDVRRPYINSAMAIILDGKKLSEEILDNLKKKIRLRSLSSGGQGGKRLKLAAVLVGKDKNSKIFLKQKEKACKFVGIDFQLYQFSENISQENLAKAIKGLRYKLCHGIIIQLPLPEHIDTEKILSLIPAEKDVDVLSGKNPSASLGQEAGIVSPVLAGILTLLKEYKINLPGKKVAVVGRGRLVGKPVFEWLKKHRIEVIEDIKKADIVISGVGKPGFIIKGEMIKNSAVVVDAAGDVDFKSVFPKAGYITPIPGGVGPMTVAMLLKNFVILNKKN